MEQWRKDAAAEAVTSAYSRSADEIAEIIARHAPPSAPAPAIQEETAANVLAQLEAMGCVRIGDSVLHQHVREHAIRVIDAAIRSHVPAAARTALPRLLRELRRLREAARWIPVSERLPELTEYALKTKKKYVLACDAVGRMTVAYCTGARSWHSGHATGEIVAWRPLPAPPEPTK